MSKILFFINVWRKSVFDIYFTEFGTALFQYCYKYCYSDSRNLWAVLKAGVLALSNMIQPNISLEMPVPSQGHYCVHSFPVVDWFCLFIWLWVWLSLCKIVWSSVILLLPLSQLRILTIICRDGQEYICLRDD